MRDIKGFVVWLGGVMFVTAVVVLMFYAAALVLPLLLVIFLVSVLANWGVSVYKRTQRPSGEKTYYKTRRPDPSSRIIDAEYEIVDDERKRNP